MSDEGEKKVFGVKSLWLVIAVVVIALVAGGAWYMLGRNGTHKVATATGDTQSASAEPLPGGACGTALARVRDYGVVPFNSTLSSDTDGTKTDDGRVKCAAASGDQTYSMLVDVSCDDLSNPKCLEIYRVTQGNGNSLFQKRPYSF